MYYRSFPTALLKELLKIGLWFSGLFLSLSVASLSLSYSLTHTEWPFNNVDNNKKESSFLSGSTERFTVVTSATHNHTHRTHFTVKEIDVFMNRFRNSV